MSRFIKQIILVFFILHAGVSMYAQQIHVKGQVFEKGSQEPLPGVNITIKGTFLGTVSDKDGNFSLKSDSPPFVLEFSFIGYAKTSIDIHSDTSINRIEMESRAILGQEVVISASRVEESIMASPVTIEKMSSRAVEQCFSSKRP